MTTCELPDAPGAVARLARQVSDWLALGQIGVLPTDSVYGLVCLPHQPASLARLYASKGRQPEKKCQLLIGDLSQLAACRLRPNPAVDQLTHAFWPGPLTIVAGSQAGEELGLRWPAAPFICQVMAHSGPLTATSANRSGQAEADSLAAGFADLQPPPDFCVLGPPPSGRASTVVRVGSGSWEVLREGEISAAQIAAALDK